jgi:hypothetical protein
VFHCLYSSASHIQPHSLVKASQPLRLCGAPIRICGGSVLVTCYLEFIMFNHSMEFLPSGHTSRAEKNRSRHDQACMFRKGNCLKQNSLVSYRAPLPWRMTEHVAQALGGKTNPYLRYRTHPIISSVGSTIHINSMELSNTYVANS